MPTSSSSPPPATDRAPRADRLARWALAFLALLALLTATELFLAPAALVVRDLNDPALAGPGIPQRALALHESLSTRLAPWARERIRSGEAAHAPLHDVPTTEWPIFTCVFYLQATAALQAEGVDIGYARESVEAARDLLMDPSHHTWVRTHWGDDYLHDRNVFFRSLLISGLTEYQAITGDARRAPFLRDQVETLASDLDASAHGVLEDYPGETYPIDVLAAVAYIRRADAVLGTDHSAFAQRARRAFLPPYTDDHDLVRFRVDLRPGSPAPVQPGRGIGNSWVGIYAPELWPADAERWYGTHERLFWQDRGWAAGFREYEAGSGHGEWTFEIDAGPILDGFGTSASAFGVGAARRMGRFDHAYTLSAQMVATGWPTLDGGLRFPRLFSHPAAPFLGEAAILQFLTTQPAEGMPVTAGGRLPALVGVGLGVMLLGFLLAVFGSLRLRRRWRRPYHHPRRALALVLGGGAAAVILGFAAPFAGYGGLLLVLFIGAPPRRRRPSARRRPPPGGSDRPRASA